MRILASIAFALLYALAPDASAQVRRCETADGNVIYTDRSCGSLGAVERPAAHAARPAPAPRHGCMRSLRDLVFEVGAAINANDANRLAGLYHWTGLSTREAYAVVGRLDAIARRPLVDVAPVMPDGADAAATRSGPVGLRIEQTLANGITPARAVFGLQRHFGCWWLRG